MSMETTGGSMSRGEPGSVLPALLSQIHPYTAVDRAGRCDGKLHSDRGTGGMTHGMRSSLILV